MKQYFTLDPTRALSLSLALASAPFSFPYLFVLDPVSFSLPSKLLTELCLYELYHKRSRDRINFLPSPGEVGRLPQIFA